MISLLADNRTTQLLRPCLLALMLAGAASAAKGAPVQFANFTEQTTANDFVFTNNTTSATFATVGGGSAINFTYLTAAIPGLPSDLQGAQAAHLTLSVSTTTNALNAGGLDIQPFDSTGTLSITRDAAASEGSGTRTNLLTVSFGPNTQNPSLSGQDGSGSVTFGGGTPNQVVTFTSDFINFDSTVSRALALSFTPVLNIGGGNGPTINGNFLNSFLANGSGNFSSDPPPTGPTSVPEPSTYLLISGAAGVAVLVAGLRRRFKHQEPHVPERSLAT